jgi:hypothetical protein
MIIFFPYYASIQNASYKDTPATLLSSLTSFACLSALRRRSAFPYLIMIKDTEQAASPINAADMKQF